MRPDGAEFRGDRSPDQAVRARPIATKMAPMILVPAAEVGVAAGHGVGRLGIEPRTRGLKDAREPFQGMLDLPD